MKYKTKIFCIILALSFLWVCGCAYQSGGPTRPATQDDKLKIGFSIGTLLEDRWVRDRDIFLSRAQQQEVDVIVTNANRDSDLQYRQVEDMLKQGIDILVLAPHDSTKELRCVELAKKYDVPVIAYDRLVYNANVDAYVSFDNFKVGELMAQALVEEVPRGGYLLVGGSPNDSNSAIVMDGINSVIDKYIKSGDIVVLDQTWIDGWVREDAYKFTADCIQRFGNDIDGIIVWNDSLAWGVIDALTEAQMEERVSVVGQDADLVACRRIVQGKQLMTVYKPIKELVDQTMELCMAMYNKEQIAAEQKIKDGSYEVPFWACEVVAVNAENMEATVVKDGFHIKEDIYQQADE